MISLHLSKRFYALKLILLPYFNSYSLQKLFVDGLIRNADIIELYAYGRLYKT